MLNNLTEKYNSVAKGRRWGITHVMILFAFRKLIESKQQILWGDTIHGNIERYFQRYLLPLLKQLPANTWNYNQQRKELRIINATTMDYTSDKASIMDFRSADTPETWEGFGYNWIILNEAGIILKNAYLYKNAILPMLLDFSDSKLIAVGAPKGKMTKQGEPHPFYTLHKNGVEGRKGYRSQQFTSYQSAVASKEDIDNLVEELGGHNHPIVRQEIYGEFIDAVDMPFLHAFNEDEHIGETEYNNQLPLYLAWDFNVKSTCLAIQFDEYGIYILKEYHQAGIPIICAEIMQDFKTDDIFINGDASGANDNASNETFYQIVKEALNFSFSRYRVPRSNPRHKASYLVCNHIFKHYKVKINPECKGLIRDCRMVQVVQQSGKIEIDKSDQTLTHFSDCFVSETLIETNHGKIKISNIKIGDKVLTRSGFRKVIDVWNKENIEVFDFFINDFKITCTETHRIFTENRGFIYAKDLIVSDIICIFMPNKKILWQEKQLNTTIENGTDTLILKIEQVGSTIKEVMLGFIFTFGKNTTEIFQRVITSITRMEIQVIMNYKILKCYTLVNTYNFMVWILGYILRKEKTISKELDHLPKSGTVQQKDLNGIRITHSNSGGAIQLYKEQIAKFVIKNLKHLENSVLNFAQITANRHIEELQRLIILKQSVRAVGKDLNMTNTIQGYIVVENVQMSCVGKRKVYDISVENNQEFFANGILVHNCLRYHLSAEHLDKITINLED